MTNIQSFINEPTEFFNICLIYPPTVRDVVTNDKYNVFLKVLTLSQEEIYDSMVGSPIDTQPQFAIPIDNKTDKILPLRSAKATPKDMLTPFEYLLNNCYNNQQFLALTQQAFKFFTHSEILPLFEEKQIYIGPYENLKTYKTLAEIPMLTEANYFVFQNLVRSVCGIKPLPEFDKNADPRVLRMQAKARYRDQVKAKSGQSIGLDTMLASICCMGIGITPLTIGEMSYSALSTLFTMYQNKESYEIDIQSLLAGADSKKIKPKHWIRNINE